MHTENNTSLISFDDFCKVDIRVATIIAAEPNTKARVPSYILTLDFGPLGIKTSSAQITQHYKTDLLIGRQVVAVCNFPAKKVAGVKSEVLVLASVSDEKGTVLLEPTMSVPNGSRIL